MGKSITINCLGYAKVDKDTERIYYAMSRLEIQQQTKIAKERDGLTIKSWYAQTLIGKRILKSFFSWEYTKNIPTVKVVECVPCCGNGCVVCNFSGITKPGHWNNWRDWQLVEIQKEVKEKQGTVSNPCNKVKLCTN